MTEGTVSKFVSGGSYRPDPVSVQFEDRAARLLARVYASGGGWVVTRLADPPPSEVARWAAQGIDVTGRDEIGPGEARTRWARAMVRAVYRTHRWHYRAATNDLGPRRIRRSGTPVQVEVGRALPAVGIIPRGRQVRVRMLRGGPARSRAVLRLADEDRIMDRDRGPLGRWADPQDRDWM